MKLRIVLHRIIHPLGDIPAPRILWCGLPDSLPGTKSKVGKKLFTTAIFAWHTHNGHESEPE
jgi:hypothetical protein